jgi:hypothetical protein
MLVLIFAAAMATTPDVPGDVPAFGASLWVIMITTPIRILTTAGSLAAPKE